MVWVSGDLSIPLLKDIWLLISLGGNHDFHSFSLTGCQSHGHTIAQKRRDHVCLLADFPWNGMKIWWVVITLWTPVSWVLFHVLDYLHTSSFAWGRCGMVGTYVPSTTSEIRFEAAFEIIGTILYSRLAQCLFTVEVLKRSYLKAIPARYSRQFRIWKPFYAVLSQNLFYFYDVWKVNSDLIDSVNLLLIYHRPARL